MNETTDKSDAAALEHITIVGGGTAGWLAATMLDAFLNRAGGGKKITIRLIESPDAPTIGVGEATVPAMPRTLAQLGVDQAEFFRRCNASYKLAVKFDRWNVDQDGKPIDFYNPFNAPPTIRGVDAALYYQRYGQDERFDQFTGVADALIRECRGPGKLKGALERGAVTYAFHLDAGQFSKLLAETGKRRGITHILDHVDGVELDDSDGSIAALQLRKRGRQPVQLVIDCTGFRGLLINQTLKEPFDSYADWMLNDRALAVQLPHSDPDRLEPATRSTALGAGWVWRVPLYHRIGAGYVFSSAFRTDEEAMAEFLGHLGLTEKEAQPRVIGMRVGRTRRSWVKNCVAIGLSGGFVEPLESTAIFMIEMAIRWLAAYLPDQSYPEPTRARFNRNVTDLYEEVRDFIALHYHLSNRDDTPYWLEARRPEHAPERLRENLEVWRHTLPEATDLRTSHLFDRHTYNAVLFGKGFYRGRGLPRTAPLSGDIWKGFAKAFRDGKAESLVEMPDHRALLRRLRKDETEGELATTSAGGDLL